MRAAIEAAAAVRTTTSPNPWVGAVVVDATAQIIATGATQPPGGAHAEREALRLAGEPRPGATLVTTLEPCNHHGRTPPCTDAIIAAGIRRVVVGIEDPDPARRRAGASPRCAPPASTSPSASRPTPSPAQLAPYLTHRRTGRPYVVLKLAATVDGRTAAPDGTSQWITGDGGPRRRPPAARRERRRARRRRHRARRRPGAHRAPRRRAATRCGSCSGGRRPAPGSTRASSCPATSAPCSTSSAGAACCSCSSRAGATVAHAFHAAGLVDRYVVYLAPAVFGGDDALGLFRGPGAPSIDVLPRGTFTSVCRVGRRRALGSASWKRGDG